MVMPSNSLVEQALTKVSDRLQAVAVERIPIHSAGGRILAEPLIADRDSPCLNISAMDGYAIRIEDFVAAASAQLTLPVHSVARAGYEPPILSQGAAVQVFTGAPIPVGADCVIRREETVESPGQVTLNLAELDLRQWQNVRLQAENSPEGQVVLPEGTLVNAATIGCLASFGTSSIGARRPIAVSLLTSGDELVEPGRPAEPWQIRDSNGPTLRSWLQGLPWTELVHQSRVQDNLVETRRALSVACEQSDVVILTGGVSAGDTDFVPEAIIDLGGDIVFHRLPIRPGKPVLAGFVNETLVIGLPGNPVSTTITARVIAEPLLERLAGLSRRPDLWLTLVQSDEKTLNLIWYRLIRLQDRGASLVGSRGSGDLVSLALSNGFVEVPPGQFGSGPWRAWLW
jgi:molybdopterin molybdotransferase